MSDDASPNTLGELLALCQSHSRGRWGIWTAELEGRALYTGRKLYHLNGMPFDRGMHRPITDAECCLRCGGGRSYGWPPGEPTAYIALRWATLCLKCLGLYVGLWPEVFPRLRLGVRSQIAHDNRHFAELFGNRHVFMVSGADWYRRFPFGPADDVVSDPWLHSRPHYHPPTT